MRVTHLRLKNCGLHADVELACDSPVVGVCGVNGSGKSTVLEMLRYALTGETSENIDTYVKHGAGNGSVEVTFRKNGQTHTISRQFGKTPKRKLTSTGGAELTKVKEIDTFLADLMGADRLAMNSAIFIGQGKLEEMLFRGDADRRSLFIKLVNLGFCASRADAAAAILNEVGSQVANLEPVLLSTEQLLETRSTELALALTSQLPLFNWQAELDEVNTRSRLNGQRDELARQRSQIELQLRIRRTQMVTLHPGLASPTYYQEAVAVHAEKYQQRVEASTLLQERTKLVEEVRSYRALRDEQQKLDGLIKTNHANLALLPSADKLTEDLQSINGQIGTLQVLKMDLARKLIVDRNLADLPGQIETAASAEKVASVELEQVKTALHLAVETNRLNQAQLSFNEELKRCFGSSGKVDRAVCQKCGLTVVDFEVPSDAALAELVRAAATSLQLAKDARQKVSTVELAWRSASQNLDTYQKEVPRLQAELRDLVDCKIKGRTADDAAVQKLQADLLATTNQQRQRTQLDSQGSSHGARWKVVMVEQLKLKAWLQVPAEQLTTESVQKISADLKILDAWLVQENTRLQDMAAHITALGADQANLDRLVGELTQMDRKLDAEMLPEVVALLAETQSMEAVKTVLDERQAKWTASEKLVLEAKAAHKAVVDQVAEIKRRMEADQVRRLLMRDLILLKELFSDGGLPATVVGHYFQKLSTVTRRHLQSLNANFRIEIDQQRPLTFCFERTDRPEGILPMGKLSGGQKVRLCLAFLMAVQEVLVPDVGLLVLDEVSDSLDDEGVESLAELLRGMAGRLQNADHQLWVVDHRKEIASALPVRLELQPV